MWQEVERRIADNEADGKLPAAPLRRAILDELKKAQITPVHTVKKMVSFELPGGERLLWELTSPAINFFVRTQLKDQLIASGFPAELRPFDHSRLPNGGRHSALSLDWSFGQEGCVCTKIQGPSDIDRLISAFSIRNTSQTATGLSRDKIEAAMTAFDKYKEVGARSDVFGAFGEPREFWVRSSRERENRVYPTKPIVAFAKKLDELNGGWSTIDSAAAALHNAGFVVVNAKDQPVDVPEKGHLLSGAAGGSQLAMRL